MAGLKTIRNKINIRWEIVLLGLWVATILLSYSQHLIPVSLWYEVESVYIHDTALGEITSNGS